MQNATHYSSAWLTLLSNVVALMPAFDDKIRLLLAGHCLAANDVAASRSSREVESHKISKSTAGVTGTWARSESPGESNILESKN